MSLEDDMDVRMPDDIRVVYHPSTQQPTKTFRFEQYKQDHDRSKLDPDLLGEKPWAPFSSRDDFELAELCLQAGLNRAQIETLLQLFTRAKAGLSEITFTSFTSMQDAWTAASVKHSPVCIIYYTVCHYLELMPYK